MRIGDGSNICPVCSESVGAEGLVCKICNECLHAACEEVVAEGNLAEYTCRTCLTVGEADHLHSSPGRVPPGQPNGNDGTPEAEPSPCSTQYTSRLPIATFRQNQTEPLSIVPYQPGQAPAFLLPSPVPTVPSQHKNTAHTPELKKMTTPEQKRNRPQLPPTNQTVSKESYDHLHSKYNQLKEDLDTLKSQQNTAQRKIQAKEKQIKKREADLTQKEAQQRQIYEHNRLLKDYSHSLELKINDLEEQNKQLKLNLLTSENLRTNPPQEQHKLPVHESKQNEESKQEPITHINETVMALLTTSMATISTNMVALQNLISQVNQSQRPHIKITNVYPKENNHKRAQRTENMNHNRQKINNSIINNDQYDSRRPTNETSPQLEEDQQQQLEENQQQHLYYSSGRGEWRSQQKSHHGDSRSSDQQPNESSHVEDWCRKEQKSIEPQQIEARYSENWRQRVTRSDGDWRKQKQRAERRSDELWWRRDMTSQSSNNPEVNTNDHQQTGYEISTAQCGTPEYSQQQSEPETANRQRPNDQAQPIASQTNHKVNPSDSSGKVNDPAIDTQDDQANESVYELASEDFLGSSRKPKTPDKAPLEELTPKHRLRITTFNVEGIKSNIVYINDILQNCDILCIQEHWLLNFETQIIKEYFPNHTYKAKCIDDETPSLPKFRSRGHAGTATIWQEKIDHLIEPLPDGSDRIIVVKINSEPEPTILINTYMLTTGSTNADYDEVLDEVHELLQKFTGYNILWTGDINAMMQRQRPTKNDEQFSAFCSENELVVSEKMPANPTFHHFNSMSTSQIDLFIHHRLAESPINQITIQSRDPLNTSLHDPVTAVLPTKLPDKTRSKTNTSTLPMKPCWDKVDKDMYEMSTKINLKALADHIADMPPTIIAERLHEILVTSAKSSSPPTKHRRKRTSTYKWLRSFKPYAQAVNNTLQALMLRNPKDRKTSTEYHQHKAAKHRLRQIQRQAAAKQRQEEQAAIIHSCENNNRENFYRLIQQKTSPQITQRH